MVLERASLIVHGRVQGVFYRVNAQEVARSNSLKGVIWNKSNGDVEAIVEGERSDIEIFIKWCKKGPKLAEVKDVYI